MTAQSHIEAGMKIARHIFERRGNHSEAHLSEGELAAIVAVGYKQGAQEAAPELAAELKQALVGLEYLRPEWFDEHEHEAEFDAQLARIRAALEKAGVL